MYNDFLKRAKSLRSIVYKTRFNRFAICKSLWSLALKVIRQPIDVCFYELITSKQCTYFDLDLKVEEYVVVPKGVANDPWAMLHQFIELLS